MSAGGAILFLAAIWLTIHVLYRVWKHRAARTILPAYLGSNAHSNRSTKVSLNALQLRLSTTKWNVYHDRLSTFLTRRGKRNVHTLLQLVYSLGSVFGALGMFVAVAGLIWMSSSSAWTLYQRISARNALQSQGTNHRIFKRMLESSVYESSVQGQGIIPIVCYSRTIETL